MVDGTGPNRTLSQVALRKAVLGRQSLLSRSTGSVPGVLLAIGGLQAQYAPSMYIGLWSRTASFARGDLTAGLENRTVVQGTLQRITIHLVDRSDYWAFALATRDTRRSTWLRAYRDRVTEAELVEAAERVRAALGDGPRTRTQLEELVGKDLARGVGLWIDLLRVPPAGTWERRRADLYADAGRELGPSALHVHEAQLHFLRRYLVGFGPASAADVASYTGLPIRTLKQLLAELELRRYRDEDGGELVDVPDGLLPDDDTPVPVRFLPTWDATLLVHCRRTGILPEEHRPRIFGIKTPHSFPTFLVDGMVAGTWRFEQGAIALSPFEPLSASVREELEFESSRLAEFHR